MAFKVCLFGYLAVLLTFFSCNILIARCDDDELHPYNYHLNPQDEYFVRTTLICRGWPCPNFTVVNDVTPYLQERLYSEQDIVSTTSNDRCINFTESLTNGYMELYKYRKGENEKRVEVAMAVPIVIEIVEQEDEKCSTKYKEWIYINVNNNASRDDIPQPSSSVKVEIERLESLDVYVRTFTGNFTDIKSQLDILKSDLETAKLCFSNERVLIASYDPPWKKRGRRNEIWLEKKTC
ncbi:hypothetical protein CHUAL_007793 [Chamberlinius hualienensis]